MPVPKAVAMRTVVACPPNGMAKPGVIETILVQGVVPDLMTLAHPDSYYLLLRDLWGGNLCLIEHDNMLMSPSGDILSLRALWDCPEPWCGYSYQMGMDAQMRPCVDAAFGMTCFKQIRAMLPDVWSMDQIAIRYGGTVTDTLTGTLGGRPVTHWDGLDVYFRHQALKLGLTQHAHGQGLHLKDHCPPPDDRLRQLAASLMLRDTN